MVTGHSGDLSVNNILAFGNIAITDRQAPDTITPRLDWQDRSDVMVDGEPDLFAALQWRYNMAPTLQGRDTELQSVMDWAENGKNTISVRLLSGGGGSGKTRLAAEVASRLRKQGWSAGFVPRHANQAQTIETSLRRFFLIFDYPEERMNVVRALVRAIQDIPDRLVDFPIRILLVSRRDFDEWGEVLRELGPRAGRQELAVVGTLDVDQALALFDETATNFAALTVSDLPDLSQTRDWLAANPANRVPLVVMAASIHQVLTGQRSFGLGGPKLIRALANFERGRAARISHDAGLGADGLPRLLSLAALTESGLSDQQCEALAELGVCEIAGQGLIDRLKRTPWRRRREDGQGFHLARPEPDRMAATFLALSLLEDQTHRLPDWLAEVALPQRGGFGDVISRVGYDLLGMPVRWSSSLEQALIKMIMQDHSRAALFLDVAMKEGSVFSAGFAVVISQHLLTAEGLNDEWRRCLFNNLSGFLSTIGRREDALKAAQEAVTLCHKLAEARPKAFTPDLAMSLNNLAARLSNLGRHEDAREAAQEAVTLYRQLAEARPEAFTTNLAGSLNNLAAMLSDLGQRQESREAAQEAVTLYHQLAETCPETYTPDLAMSLNTLVGKLADLGQREDARETAQEAVMLYRLLAEAHPAAFMPDLAMSLNNLANTLSDSGRREDARGAAQEAVMLYRQLAKARPEAFTPDLAKSLNTLANSLSGLNRREDAREAAQEAVILYRQLAETRPEAFTPDLVRSLNTLAVMLSGLGLYEGAREASQQAVLLYRQLAEARPEAFMSGLAMSLNNLAAMLADLGLREDACEAAQEAVTLYRQLVEARPEAFTPDLAMSLSNLATRLSNLFRHEDARETVQEAVTLYRQLAEAHPEAFTPNLATSLNTLANSLSDLNRREDALIAVQEAVMLRRRLAEACPEAFTLNLAMSLNNLAAMLSDLERRENAREAVQEAVKRMTPYFLNNPLNYAHWMTTMVQNYRRLCEKTGNDTDLEMLAPVLTMFEQLNEAQQRE